MNQKIGFILGALFVLLAGHSTLFAQEIQSVADEDMLAPFIDHSVMEGTQPEKTPIEVHATITDDNAVSKVSLFYRAGAASQKNEGYTEMTMTSNQTDGYDVSIPAEKMLGPKLEYYIQASDMAGNTASKGNVASPLVVSVGTASPSDQASVQAATANEPDNKASVVEDVALFSTNNDAAAGESDAIYKPAKPWYKKWWVWTIAGVVLVGAAAGGGGGSGSSGGDSGSLSIAW
jgi:hypothetical protein